MTISGMIKKVKFYNQDNGYLVAAFFIDYESLKTLKDHRIFNSETTIVGIVDRAPYEEESYQLEGEFIEDSKFGWQFKFSSYARKSINNVFGLISYLSSDLFPGIGQKAASKIVEALGKDTIKKIKEDPNCLNGLKLSNEQKSTIISGIATDEYSRDATIFLLELDLSNEMIHKIIKAYEGLDVIEIIKENPYALIEKIERFGFKKTDALAMKLGFKKNDEKRMVALISFVLNEILYGSGNSYINQADFYMELVSYTNENIEHDFYNKLLKKLVKDQKIFIDEYNNIFDYNGYMAEIDLANEISLFLKNERNGKEGIKKYDQRQIDEAYKQVVEESDLDFSEEQIEAIQKAFTEPIVIITGGPGTGKTTIVKAIIKMYLKLNYDSTVLSEAISLVAPTGRAAKRLKEATMVKSSTIHKYLGFDGAHFEYNKFNRTTDRLIIVDEASMMDVSLASRLITSMHPEARLIIVGDVDQLPSVGPGQVLKDLIDSKEIITIRLKHIHRQASDSSIIKLAHSVNEGYLPENLIEKLNDRIFIPTDKEHLPKMIVDLYLKTIQKGKSIKDVQVLIPMYKGPSGINEINNQIQECVNPLGEGNQIKNFGQVFRIGDKVIQLINRAEKNVMNGDIGYVKTFIKKNDKIVGLEVSFDTVVATYEDLEVDDLALAYAISIHKSQGSEFDIVIMPFTSNYYVMLKRKLIYTGITRAKKVLMMIGEVPAMQMGIKYLEKERLTILKEKIKEFLHGKSLKESLNEMKELNNINNNNNIDDDNLEDEIGAIEIKL